MNSFNREQAEREAKYSRQGSNDSPSLFWHLSNIYFSKVTAMDDLLPQWPLMKVKVVAKIEETLW
jgi:hypothetical protein